MLLRVKKLLAILTVVVIVVACVFAAFFSTPEPMAEGRTLSEWLEQGRTTEVTNAVRKIGADAVPVLLAKLSARHSVWEYRLDNHWGRKIFSHRWLNLADYHHEEALLGFSILGTQAVSALPELQRICLDTNGFERVGEALSYLGPEALPVLKAALTNQDDQIRWRAAWGIVSRRETAQLCIPEIMALQNDRNEWLLHAAFGGARRVLPQAEFLPIATHFIQSNNRQTQKYVLGEISRTRANSTAYIPLIVPFLTNSYGPLRRDATNALRILDPAIAARHGVSTNRHLRRPAVP
jgi:hypothetical protein